MKQFRHFKSATFLIVLALAWTQMTNSASATGSGSMSQSSVGNKIAAAAEACLGKKMWEGYGLSTGYLGCAAAVSNVLKTTGFTTAHSAAVTLMRQQLLGCKNIREIIICDGAKDKLTDSKLIALARPGDILVAFAKPPAPNYNGGGNAHCGILSTPTEICTNDWNDGVWKKLNIHLMFDYYPYVRLIRLDKV